MHDGIVRIQARPRGLTSTRRRFLQGSAALAGVTLLSGCSIPPFGSSGGPKVRTIGALAVQNPIVQDWMGVWEKRLAELGYVDGKTATFERRIAASLDGFPPLVADLLDRKVDIVMASGWAAMKAAKAATSTVPVVGVSSDPVGTGLVTSIVRPGGNITGLTTL